MCVAFYRRRLPHVNVPGQPVFLTWRLHGSLPRNYKFPEHAGTSGRAFAALDKLLDEARRGPVYLRQPALAEMTVEAIHYSASALRHSS